MSIRLTLLTLALALCHAIQAAEPAFIVKDGQPMAEIVIPEDPPNAVRMAAQELQTYIEKMTGATLPIVPPFALNGEKPERLFQQYPTDMQRYPVKIYLGQSYHTDRLGLSVEGLEWDAYKMQSGDGWLALLGKDNDFIPMGIWGRTRGHWRAEGEAAWKEAIGEENHWQNQVGAKMWNAYNQTLDLWAYDGKGSLNAVYGFLRQLGVRWYMPGELGEIVPKMASIELPSVDKTVTPDMKIRTISFMRYGNGDRILPEIIWSIRQGMNYPMGYRSYHGMVPVTRPEETRRLHPEYYALYNGKRDIESGTPNPCLSSEGLFRENVEYLRFAFDLYDVPALAVWPDDGFTAICQCPKCEGKDDPERGRQGVLSNYVWDYINRVAIELYKTHPDKIILGGAYSTYWMPPTNIETLSPNVAVHIVNARRRYNIPAEDLEVRREHVKRWAELTDNKVITFMNFGGGANTPRIFADDIKFVTPYVIGEDMWVAHRYGGLAQHGWNHLNYYVCARLWWDVERDTGELLSEYYQDFYGPAAEEMEAFIDYYEKHQHDMRGIQSAPIIKKALDLFAVAEAAVEPDTVYGQRVAMFSEGLAPKRKFYDQIKDGRPNPPLFTMTNVAQAPTIDGQLTEALWQELPGRLKEIQEGGEVEHPTHFNIAYDENNLYFGIKVMDEPGNPANIAPTDGDDDDALWQGDAIELLLETPTNSYYQIAINPAGAVCDLDRSEGLAKGFTWGAEAEVATHVNKEEGYWIVEARVPFTPSSQDPLHEIIGPTPSAEAPWFFNLCRQRMRDEGNVLSAFAPTGKKGFHYILTFGKLGVE